MPFNMPTKDEWDKKKETIRQLWLVQGQTLLEVSYSLAALGFDAT